jgi:hypothetical protein
MTGGLVPRRPVFKALFLSKDNTMNAPGRNGHGAIPATVGHGAGAAGNAKAGGDFIVAALAALGSGRRRADAPQDRRECADARVC